MLKSLPLSFVLLSILYPQELYDPYKVHSINIEFYNPGYDSILQARWDVDDKTYELADITVNGVTYDSVGARYKGNSTFFLARETDNPKFPFNIDVEHVHNDQDVMGYEKLKLSNALFDVTFVKETLGYLLEGLYLPTPQAGYMNVSVNGTLMGLYVNVESINKQFLRKHFGNDQGTFFKCEPQFHFGEDYLAWPDLKWYGADSNAYAYQKGYEMKSDHGWTDLLELIYTLNYNIDNIEEILNVDRVLWFFAASTVIPDLDNYFWFVPHNFYLYKNASGQFEIIPWDKDHTFGNALINVINDVGGNIYWIYYYDPFDLENNTERPLFSKLMQVPLYKLLYTAHLRTIIEDVYNVDYIYNWATEIQDSIETYAYEDPNLFFPFIFGDYFRYNVDNFLDSWGIQFCGITSTVEPRLAYLSGHAEIAKTPPVISSVTQDNLTPAPGDTVFINTVVENATQVELMVTTSPYGAHFESVEMHDDGLHQDGGENDQIYGAYIPYFSNGIHVKYYIRALDNDAVILEPQKAERVFFDYTIGSSSLTGLTPTINEINYHSSDNFNPDDWVEIYNPTDSTFDMGAWEFKDESDDHIFIIPQGTLLEPNEYITICRDTVAFKNHFPGVQSYIGDLGYGLSGGGELIRLYDNGGFLVDSLTYDDEEPWPLEPDGNGPTLELTNPLQDNGHFSYWSASTGNGTPGAVNSNYLGKITASTLPENFRLYQNYPNPFNPVTNIMYYLPERDAAIVKIFDALGREIRVLDNGNKESGYHTVRWDGKDGYGKHVSAGIYLYQLQAGRYIQTNKMVLIK